MSQISPPIRILLVASFAVLAVYMLFLRPKAEVAPPATPAPNVQTGAPAVSQPGKIAQADSMKRFTSRSQTFPPDARCWRSAWENVH